MFAVPPPKAIAPPLPAMLIPDEELLLEKVLPVIINAPSL